MNSHKLLLCLVLCSLMTLLAGCGQDADSLELQIPDWLNESTADQSTMDPSTIAATPTATAPPLERASLGLTVQVGDRFPLRKVVEQELRQASLDGNPQISRSQLELLLGITVDDVQPDRTRFSVRYDRVRYTHEIAGELVSYDSASPPADVPPGARAYHGMVGDGFSFWIGADHQIAGVDGFREFLERSLRHTPPEHRQQMLMDIEANSGENGISDFIDNAVGLLPPRQGPSGVGEKVLGDSWKREQHIARPVPMQIHTVYTLADIQDGVVGVTISGEVIPSTTLGHAGQANEQVRVTVKGGRSQGHCTIFRDTGLPKESRVERIVDMTVQMAGGIEFDQQKRTVTTVEAYPPQRIVTTSGEQAGPRFR